MHIILATANRHKIRELQAMINDEHIDKNINVIAYEDILPTIDICEDGTSFKANATIKLKAIYQAFCTYCESLPLLDSKMPDSKSHGSKKSLDSITFPLYIIAEDSGLCVRALNDEPGIYSARYARYKHFTLHNGHSLSPNAPNSTDSENLQCLIAHIAHIAPTSAFFHAHIAMIKIESLQLLPFEQCHIQHFVGTLKGEVIAQIKGKEGFGYDPIFIPNENNPKKQTLAELPMSAKNRISHRYKALLACLKYMFHT